jgi:hypothetical protein
MMAAMKLKDAVIQVDGSTHQRHQRDREAERYGHPGDERMAEPHARGHEA